LKNGRWGGTTHRGNTVYVFVKEWQGDKLPLEGLPAKILSAKKLVGGEAVPFTTDKGTELTLPAAQRDPFFTVIALTLDAK
jgi:alpha-L-fucosidase